MAARHQIRSPLMTLRNTSKEGMRFPLPRESGEGGREPKLVQHKV